MLSRISIIPFLRIAEQGYSHSETSPTNDRACSHERYFNTVIAEFYRDLTIEIVNTEVVHRTQYPPQKFRSRPQPPARDFH